MISTEISPDVAALVEALRDVSPGKTITYDDLSNVIGRNIKTVFWMLLRAKTIAARDHGAIFGTQRGVGCTRLTTEALSDLGSTARAHIRRASRKGAKFMRYGLERANEVSPEAQRKINAELSALALIEHVSQDKAASPVEAHDQRPEPVAVTARRLFPELS